MVNIIKPLIKIMVILALPAIGHAQDTIRPKVGLVLSGGGAKGAAHLGVIEVLEQHRIPVDIVTGTSMGAYVGGMYAMGLSAEELKRKTLEVNWQSGYDDRVGRNELLLRKKQDGDEYPLHTDIGLSLTGEFKQKSAIVQGQTMAILLRGLTENLPNLDSFDQLAIPYRCVATDIALVQTVVIDSGNLATAMQASMTVPGALKPIEWQGKQLVDGGVVNNMPIDVAQALGAEVIIAIDLRDPLFDTPELESALNIIGQLTTHMTNSTVDRQISLMQKRDVYLRPDVSFMTAGDFDKMEQAYEAGRQVALAALPKLRQHQLSAPDYRIYQNAKENRRNELTASSAYHIDKIKLTNNTRLSDQALMTILDLEADRVITNEELEAAVKYLYAQDIFDRITYQIEHEDALNVLHIDVNEKSWGPGYLNFKLTFEDNSDDRTDFTLGTQYTYTNLTEHGGEWQFEWLLGSRKKIATELYFPLENQQRAFTSFGVSWNSEVRQFFFDNIEIMPPAFNQTLDFADVEYNYSSAFAELGWNLKPWSAIALGYLGSSGNMKLLLTGEKQDFYAHGPYIRYTYDYLNNLYFATSGWFFETNVGYAQAHSKYNGIVADEGAINYNIRLFKPFSFERHTLSAHFKGGGSNSQEQVPIYVQGLGGLLNLSGYQRDELNGRYSLFGALSYRYRLVDNNFGIVSSPIYLGGSVERGGVWNDDSQINWRSSETAGSLYIGIDAPIGPIHLGIGYAESGKGSFYLMLGSSLN
jgi:NTE family protein